MIVLRPQTHPPEFEDNPSTSSTAVPISTTPPIANATFPTFTTTPSPPPALITPSDGATPPRWLSDAVSELSSLKGPEEWVSVVAGLLALDRSLGFPTGKVRIITSILSRLFN
jgi:hypothetical protein